MELVDQFSQMFLCWNDVDAITNVLNERAPRDDGKRYKDASPVRQDLHCCI